MKTWSKGVLQHFAHRNKKLNYEQTNFYDICKIFAANNVISLDEDFSQSTFPNWVVLRIELVKSVESVAILDIQAKKSY